MKKMEQYNVTGMSCTACSAQCGKSRIESSGGECCSVSLLTNSMGVEGTASSGEIIAAVEAAGYGASLKGGTAGEKISMSAAEEALEDHETPILKRKSDHIRGIFAGADVFFHGTYDVGLATAGMV